MEGLEMSRLLSSTGQVAEGKTRTKRQSKERPKKTSEKRGSKKCV